jgi:TolB-like protein/DNA-binding SARP family transcriptional activator/Tfp pilus assembly protein PilF
MGGRREPSVMSNVKTAQVRQLRSVEGAVGLRMHLLGPMTITLDGRPVAIAAKKARALLGYLALREGSEVARGVLTGLLWGDCSEGQARASLRQTLSELKSALGEAASSSILASKEAVAWVQGSAWIDARLVESAAGSTDDAVLREAAKLAGGELMEGLSVGDAGFEQWLMTEREHFRLLACTIHARLMERAEQGGRLEEALTHGLKLLSLDPLQEHVHRALMRLYAAQGRYDAALAQYERCRRELSSQLGVRPEAETDNLARCIGTSRREGPARPQTTPSPQTEALHRQIGDLPDTLVPSARTQPADYAGDSPSGGQTTKPSIAVLPFRNLNAELDQQYLSDGITEDIITELSRFRQLFVIARNSSFQYRGKDVDVKRIGRELGVGYVVEGSIRRVADRVLITAQLIDASTGGHLWADRFNCALQDVFAVQDEVTQTIVATLAIRLEDEGLAIAKRKPPQSMRAYDYRLRGKNLMDLWTRQGNEDAKSLFQKAAEVDPSYARAKSGLALTYQWAAYYSAWGGDNPASHERAEGLAQEAMQLDPTDHVPHVTLAWIYAERRDYVRARRHLDQAEALNPNDADMLIAKAMMLSLQGEPGAALVLAHSAMRLNPRHPDYYLAYLAHCYLMAGRCEEAKALSESLCALPEGRAILVVICVKLGQLEEAQYHAGRFLADFPTHWIGPGSASFVVDHLFHYKNRVDSDMMVEALIEAGVPMN